MNLRAIGRSIVGERQKQTVILRLVPVVCHVVVHVSVLIAVS